MTMPSDKSSQAAAGTLSLIEVCEWELERLRKIRADYRATIEASRKIIAGRREAGGRNGTGVMPARTPPVPLLRPLSKFFIERAEETRTIAENVKDPLAKRLLLEIADGYDHAAE
jgi:hypothetical protein